MDTDTLKKWAEELQKRERYLQEREKEFETKLKKQSEAPLPLSHTTSSSNLTSTSSSAPNSAHETKKVITSGRFKGQASRKPYRLQPLSEKNGADGASPTPVGSSTSPSPTSSSQHHTNIYMTPKDQHNAKSITKTSTRAKTIRSLALQEAISDKQVADALAAFNTVDRDHNGVIDSYELYDALKVLYGEDISRPEANKFYLSIDSNRSGFITFDEFLHATIQYHWDISLLQHARLPNNKSKLGSLEHEWEIPYEELVFEAKLGEGTYGVVYKGKWRHTTVAIKELKVSEMKEKLLTDFRNEISIMGRLRHPNVILYMGACTKEPHFCIVTELLPGGSIYDVLHTRRARFDMKLALYFAKQTALAINYLHMSTPQIVHRDLKTENLLLDNHLNVKVCDFGLSCVKPPREVLKEQVGSPLWMAPEVLAGGTYDERCDVYSFALVLWEFFANQLPYSECEEFHQLVDIVVNQKKRPPIPAHTPLEIVNLIKQCWDPDPGKRPTFATIVETIHEIVRQHKE